MKELKPMEEEPSDKIVKPQPKKQCVISTCSYEGHLLGMSVSNSTEKDEEQNLKDINKEYNF